MSGGKRLAIIIVGVIIAVWVVIHVVAAEESRPYPPVSCQILGGRWDIWDGWRCG